MLSGEQSRQVHHWLCLGRHPKAGDPFPKRQARREAGAQSHVSSHRLDSRATEGGHRALGVEGSPSVERRSPCIPVARLRHICYPEYAIENCSRFAEFLVVGCLP